MDSAKGKKQVNRLPSWNEMQADTAEWADTVLMDFFREAPPWRKLQMAAELTDGMLVLVESGLRNRHPNCSPADLRRLMADVLLGPQLAAKFYSQAHRSD